MHLAPRSAGCSIGIKPPLAETDYLWQERLTHKPTPGFSYCWEAIVRVAGESVVGTAGKPIVAAAGDSVVGGMKSEEAKARLVLQQHQVYIVLMLC